MNTLCIAVVLSLLSVSHSAPLTCEQLLKTVEKGPDLSGKWYAIAESSNVCLIPLLVNTILFPSFSADVTLKISPDTYSVDYNIKMHGYCVNESTTIFYKTNTIFEVERNGVIGKEPNVLLQTGCPDCIVVKAQDTPTSFLLISRRKTVSAEELKEFETQAQCLGWSKPQIYGNDHDFENCQWLGNDDADADVEGLSTKISQRLKNEYEEIKKCIWDLLSPMNILSHIKDSLF